MCIMDSLQKSINFIEENLEYDLSLQDIAYKAGFSTYHFSRIFKDHVGMPVSAFVTQRRLLHIIYNAKESKNLVDTALFYGFDTYAGFYKAFIREFGCSPSRYLKLNKVNKPMGINLMEEANIVLTQTQIRQLLSYWDIDTNYSIEDATVNGESKVKRTWRIGDNFIFKTGKNLSGFRTHIEVSKALANVGVETSSPILTRDGNEYIVEGDRYYALVSKIEGEFLTNKERYQDNRFETGKKYGEAIGKLHNILKDQDDNIQVDDTNILDIVTRWALPETKKIMEQWNCPLPEEFYQDYITNFSKYYSELPRQVIHRDPNPTNIIFKDYEVKGFIDFELSERNVRIFDPCYCATGILSETDNLDENFEKWLEIQNGIIHGYDNICHMTDIEKAAIPYIMYSIQMIFIAWLNGKEEYKNLAIKNRNILLKVYDYFTF